MPRSPLPDGSVRKLIEIDAETWTALRVLSADSMKSVQELADEAFADLLRKHGRPVLLGEALRQSAKPMVAATSGRPQPRRSGGRRTR